MHRILGLVGGELLETAQRGGEHVERGWGDSLDALAHHKRADLLVLGRVVAEACDDALVDDACGVGDPVLAPQKAQKQRAKARIQRLLDPHERAEAGLEVVGLA